MATHGGVLAKPCWWKNANTSLRGGFGDGERLGDFAGLGGDSAEACLLGDLGGGCAGDLGGFGDGERLLGDCADMVASLKDTGADLGD